LRVGRRAFAPRAGPARMPPRVIDDEVDVGEILRGLFNVPGVTMLFVEKSQRKPLVDADVLDSQFARALPERIRVLFVVEPVGARAIIVSLSMNSSLM